MTDDEGDMHDIITVLQAYTTQRGVVQAIETLRADGFDAATIGVTGRHRRVSHGVARATGVTPIDVTYVGLLVGLIGGAAIGLLGGSVLGVLPSLTQGGALVALVGMTLLGAAVGGVAGAIAGTLGAVNIPPHGFGVYARRFAAGDLIVVVGAGDRAQEAEQILVRGLLPRAA
jgi:hypothetical protein